MNTYHLLQRGVSRFRKEFKKSQRKRWGDVVTKNLNLLSIKKKNLIKIKRKTTNREIHLKQI